MNCLASAKAMTTLATPPFPQSGYQSSTVLVYTYFDNSDVRHPRGLVGSGGWRTRTGRS
ncbi:hypothetical protein BV25DRAFT_1823426 [Artomyces pyxidatus]|uniref:Uncharacterized protein n=1 Tax=Artomyces pyxidatus TaxID=48021 RepID=A0ACB8T6U3_9AGAM|nr:hypothetical protein BV25DRAFT_1823426 [Artomyces pyxidatus]